MCKSIPQFRIHVKKVKWSRYKPGVAQRLGRVISLLFQGCDTRRGLVVSSTPRPHFTPGKEPVTILQEAGWASGPVWTGGKSLPHRHSIPDRPARSSVAIPTELPDPLRIHLHSHKSSSNVSAQSAIDYWTSTDWYLSKLHSNIQFVPHRERAPRLLGLILRWR